MAKVRVTPFQNSSILRKFTVFYLLMSILPLFVLYHVYLQVIEYGALIFNRWDLELILVWTVCSIGVGYLATRILIKNMIDVTEANREMLQNVFGEEQLRELAGANDEIAVMSQSFNEITERLEHNIKDLEVAKAAVATENALLNERAERTYFETISALALAVDAKDRYSAGHLDRVANYSLRIADQLGLSSEEILTLRDAARLHDLGKIGIADDVLNKPGSLTKEEWDMMKKHPEIGESIIKPINSLSHLCDIVRHHHEKLDGSGYPDGLKGDQISKLVRILTVADIYDAMTTDRPYRKAFTPAQAQSELQKMVAANQLDGSIVDAFIQTLNTP